MRGRNALVSGGSGALGSAIALALARAGTDAIIVGYDTSPAAAESVAEQARALGAGTSETRRLTLDSGDTVERAVRSVLDQFGHLDILVCAAGVNDDSISWRMSDDRWARVLDVNLTGVHRLTRAVLPAMRAARHGRIVALSSVVGQLGIAGTSAYAASKAGLLGYIRAVAREAAPSNVTVNALALGYFDGGMLRRLSDEARSEILHRIPLGRFGHPDEVGRAVTFLCGPEAGYITGQVLNVNGGIVG